MLELRFPDISQEIVDCTKREFTKHMKLTQRRCNYVNDDKDLSHKQMYIHSCTYYTVQDARMYPFRLRLVSQDTYSVQLQALLKQEMHSLSGINLSAVQGYRDIILLNLQMRFMLASGF